MEIATFFWEVIKAKHLYSVRITFPTNCQKNR
jgi:hypothetical protein